MSWGKRIAGLYLGFVALIVTMVFLAMKENTDLVSKDYYAQELAYTDKMERMKRSLDLQEPWECKVNGNSVFITFPSSAEPASLKGTVLFFRPDEAAADKRFPVQPGEGNVQQISLAGLKKGHYLVQVNWSMRDTTYYNEAGIKVD